MKNTYDNLVCIGVAFIIAWAAGYFLAGVNLLAILVDLVVKLAVALV